MAEKIATKNVQAVDGTIGDKMEQLDKEELIPGQLQQENWR